MDRIVVLGGGVGGTLAANLLSRRLRARIDRREASVTVLDATAEHVYQPGFMYIAMDGERESDLVRPERQLLDRRVQLVEGRAMRIDPDALVVTYVGGLRLEYDYLVIATGSRIVPEEIPGFASHAHHFYGPAAARSLRAALDAFSGGRIVIGIAGMPYKCPPAPLEIAFLIDAELRHRGLRQKTEMHYCSPIGRAFTIESVSDMATPILAQKNIELHTFFNVESIDAERRSVVSLEGEELGYDLLILVPPHRGAQVVIDSGLAPPAGWLPTDPHTLEVRDRKRIFAIGDATDLPLSKAGSTAHFEAPVVVERIVAAVEGREPDPRRGSYTGKVMCFFEVGDGKGTLLQFDYDHPPRPPRPNRLWHLGKLVFNKTYWHTVPKGRI
jgi:sulfide:quinone oxidoreductase